MARPTEKDEGGNGIALLSLAVLTIAMAVLVAYILIDNANAT